MWPPHSLTPYTRQRLSPLRSVPIPRDRSSRDSVFRSSVPLHSVTACHAITFFRSLVPLHSVTACHAITFLRSLVPLHFVTACHATTFFYSSVPLHSVTECHTTTLLRSFSALALSDYPSHDTIGYHSTLPILVLLVRSTTCTVYSP